MILNNTVRLGVATLAVAGACLVGAPQAQAQPPGGGMPPEIQAKIKAWQKWREQHKNLQTLSDMVYQIGELDKDPSNALNKDQAKKIITVLKPWHTKKEMSEDEAKTLSKQIGSVLTTKQLKKMSTIETPTQRMAKGGGFGGGGGRPGGGGPGGGRPGGAGGGGFKFPDPPAKGWNPFNPDSLPFEQARPMAKKRMDDFMGDLEKRAK